MTSSTQHSVDDFWRLPRCWALFLLALIAGTWKLWIPATKFPAVPMIASLANLPAWVGWIPVVFLLASLSAIAIFPRRSNWCWWIVAMSLGTAFLLDQHRLQPWAYQSAIYSMVFATMTASNARRCLIPLAISVYLYSGLGKLDYQFAHTVGQDLINMAAQPLGGLPATWDQSFRVKIALIMPAGEILAGVLLVFRRLRPIAGVFVILMHATLIALLGPWGMDHSLGVLIWNLLLIVQAWFLFVRPDGENVDSKRTAERSFSPLRSAHSRRIRIVSALACGWIVLAIIAPLLERSGYWDHWLSWALYSPHSSRVDLEIHRSALDLLDPSMHPFIETDHDGDGWQRLAMDRWSLDSLGVPIYPQARYQLGLADTVARRHQLGDAVRARIRGVADRWSGRRTEQLAIGEQELTQATKQFWLGR